MNCIIYIYINKTACIYIYIYIYISYYNSSSVCVCVRVCSLSPPRSFDGSSPNLVAVCRWTSHLPLRGSFSKRSTGRWVNGSLSLFTILYMRQPHATQLQTAPIALLLLHLIRLKGTFCCTASRWLVGVCRWTSEMLARRVIFPSICKQLYIYTHNTYTETRLKTKVCSYRWKMYPNTYNC